MPSTSRDDYTRESRQARPRLPGVSTASGPRSSPLPWAEAEEETSSNHLHKVLNRLAEHAFDDQGRKAVDDRPGTDCKVLRLLRTHESRALTVRYRVDEQVEGVRRDLPPALLLPRGSRPLHGASERHAAGDQAFHSSSSAAHRSGWPAAPGFVTIVPPRGTHWLGGGRTPRSTQSTRS